MFASCTRFPPISFCPEPSLEVWQAQHAAKGWLPQGKRGSEQQGNCTASRQQVHCPFPGLDPRDAAAHPGSLCQGPACCHGVLRGKDCVFHPCSEEVKVCDLSLRLLRERVVSDPSERACLCGDGKSVRGYLLISLPLYLYHVEMNFTRKSLF